MLRISSEADKLQNHNTLQAEQISTLELSRLNIKYVGSQQTGNKAKQKIFLEHLHVVRTKHSKVYSNPSKTVEVVSSTNMSQTNQSPEPQFHKTSKIRLKANCSLTC